MDPRKLCVRPTCAVLAEASLHYDYAQRTAWLEDLGPGPLFPGAWALCAAHADNLRVPDGWALLDNRRLGPVDPVPRLTAAGPG